jgi:hypothetical protein
MAHKQPCSGNIVQSRKAMWPSIGHNHGLPGRQRSSAASERYLAPLMVWVGNCRITYSSIDGSWEDATKVKSCGKLDNIRSLTHALHNRCGCCDSLRWAALQDIHSPGTRSAQTHGCPPATTGLLEARKQKSTFLRPPGL